MACETIVFTLFIFVTMGCSLDIILVRDIWHSALSLGGAFLSATVHYVMLQTESFAAMQVLVYVGGVLVLTTFVVMLTRISPEVSST